MRKSFGMDARGKDFNLDPDHARLLDAARQATGAGMEKDRARAGADPSPAVPLREASVPAE